MSKHNIYPGYWFSKFSWSTLCCIHTCSSSYMLHHLGKPIQIWYWCILPTQYELILIIVRSKVFNGKGWPSWSLTSKFLILWNNTMHSSSSFVKNSNFVSFVICSQVCHLLQMQTRWAFSLTTDHIWNTPLTPFLAVSYKHWYQQYIKWKKVFLFINIFWW